MVNKLSKSRDIPLSDYYTLLQKEYLGYYLRKKIYKRECDRKKFSDICIQKREKIESISLKNCLPSIFNDEGRKHKYFKEFLQEFGMPHFYYRDSYQEDVKGLWDILYYFDRGSSIKVKINNIIEVGSIVRVNVKDNVANVLVDGKEYVVGLSDVGRIFPDNFFDDFE